MKTIKSIHKAVLEPIADLITYRAIPTENFAMNLLDPFILLNHHGFQQFPPQNNGLPFGPHPHRGFETVTFILEGDLTHKDTSGAFSIIGRNGVQWMTAGKGLVHAEISSPDFKQKGGPLEILQLWVNLPARYKFTAPAYTGLQENEIPVKSWDNGKITAQIISGNWEGTEGAFKPFTDIHLAKVDFQSGGKHTFSIPAATSLLLYIVKGELRINGEDVSLHNTVEFNHDGNILEMKANSDTIILFGYATPFNEPFVAYGPFVMNTQEEIRAAYKDYHDGKLGKAEDF